MPSCRDIQPLITRYLDAEASDAERSVVADHLGGCSACRALAADEDAGRRIIRQRSAVCRVEAPAGLRERCRPPARTPAVSWFAIRPMPVWAPIGLVCAILGGGLVAAGRATTVFAAELALDHLKCFALFENASGPGDPGVIAERLKTDYGWTMAVPGASSSLGLRLVGGRRCFSTDGRVAHILYRHLGHPLSLFVIPRTTRASGQIAVAGHEAIMWSQRGNTYVVLARESRDELTPVAAYIRSVLDRAAKATVSFPGSGR